MATGLSFGVADTLWADLRRVFARYPAVSEVRLFGSRAQNTFRPGSDIDLAVFAAEMSDAEFAALWNELDALPLLFSMDVLHWERLDNPELRKKILSEGVKVYPVP